MAEPLFELESNFRNELNRTNWVSKRLRDAFRRHGITLGNASLIFPYSIQYQGRASEYYIIIDHSYRGPVKTPRYAVRQEKDKYAVYKAYFINHKGRTPLLTLSKAEFKEILNQEDCQLIHLINCCIHGEENRNSIEDPLSDIIPNLSGITFPINIEKILLFFRCSFIKEVDLRACNFQEDVYFYDVTFRENASFQGATFEGDAYFRETTFEKLADFIEVAFGEYVDFYGATFKGDAYFNRASFNCIKVDFTGIKRKSPIYFNHVRYWPNSIFHKWFRKLPDRITSKAKYSPEDPNNQNEKVKYKYPSGRPCKEAEFLMDSQNIDEVNSPRFKRYVADQQFIRAFRNEQPILAAIWRWSSDYGRSFGLWMFWSLMIAVFFGCVYAHDILSSYWCMDFSGWQASAILIVGIVSVLLVTALLILFLSFGAASIFQLWQPKGKLLCFLITIIVLAILALIVLTVPKLDFTVDNTDFPSTGDGQEPERESPNLLTYIYFSVVTFTTLGFGDVIPKTHISEIWLTIEVILGYVMLGGLISIFANKLARRS